MVLQNLADSNSLKASGKENNSNMPESYLDVNLSPFWS